MQITTIGKPKTRIKSWSVRDIVIVVLLVINTAVNVAILVALSAV